MGIACRCEVTSNRPMVLPVIVPVTAQSSRPWRIAGISSAKGVDTGVAPSASTQSAWVTPEMRTRRLARSASDASGLVQNATWAG